MKTMKVQALAAAAVLLSSIVTPAAHAAAEVKMGGVMFAQYVNNLDDKARPPEGNASSKGRHAFDVSRLYVTGDVKFDDNWKAKFVLEGRTDSSATQSANNNIWMKGAYLEYGNLMDWGINIQGGQMPLSWDGFEAGIHQRRYIIQQFANRYMGQATWDKGIGAYGKLPMGYGDYNVQVVNGEGEIATEGATGTAGRTKAVSALLSIVPVPNHDMLKGLRINGYVQQEKRGITDSNVLLPTRDRNFLFGGASYKAAKWHLMGTYYTSKSLTGTTAAGVATTRPKGVSFHGSYSGLPWQTTAFARWDRFDAGLDTASQNLAVTPTYGPRKVTVFGIEKKMTDGVRVALADIMDYTRNKGARTSSWMHTLGLYAEAKW